MSLQVINWKGDIHLISFSSNSDFFQLRKSLLEIGYQIKFSQMDTEISFSAAFTSDIAIFLFDEEKQIKDGLYTICKVLNGTPIFTIFFKKSITTNLEILSSCSDFATWPCSKEELELRLDRIFSRLRFDITKEFRSSDEFKEFNDLNIIGNSKSYLIIAKKIKNISQYEVPVLIEGETGTGKELAARAIHKLSPRSKNPFIAVNCGAIPDSLFENEFFGHQTGAYTNADSTHSGFVEQANGGTLFLDEIDTLSLKGQITLLRFLQDGFYRPLGFEKLKSSDVRIISATNSNLWEKVKEKLFRKDLFFRLGLMELRIPPLREREEDLELLTNYFLNKYRAKYKQFGKYLDQDSLLRLRRYYWPGNIRELENLIHREFLLTDGKKIQLNCLEDRSIKKKENKRGIKNQISFNKDFKSAKSEIISFFEKEYLSSALKIAKGNVTLAARYAKKERRSFGKLLKKNKIKYGS